MKEAFPSCPAIKPRALRELFYMPESQIRYDLSIGIPSLISQVMLGMAVTRSWGTYIAEYYSCLDNLKHQDIMHKNNARKGVAVDAIISYLEKCIKTSRSEIEYKLNHRPDMILYDPMHACMPRKLTF